MELTTTTSGAQRWGLYTRRATKGSPKLKRWALQRRVSNVSGHRAAPRSSADEGECDGRSSSSSSSSLRSLSVHLIERRTQRSSACHACTHARYSHAHTHALQMHAPHTCRTHAAIRWVMHAGAWTARGSPLSVSGQEEVVTTVVLACMGGGAVAGGRRQIGQQAIQPARTRTEKRQVLPGKCTWRIGAARRAGALTQAERRTLHLE